MDPRATTPERRLPAPRGLAPAGADVAAGSWPQSPMRLVGQNRLTLDLCDPAAPADWHAALTTLLDAHRIALEAAAALRSGGLRQVARWATGAGQAPPSPVFAPWQAFSPTALQNPLARAALPSAQWLVSYLFDPAPPRAGGAGCLDVMVASPHPAACLEDEAGHAPLPRKAVLNAMIAAARDEGRERLALIVPAHARSAMAQRLLAGDRALTRGDMALEIVAIEDAISRLIRSAETWDALIVMPECRSIIAAILAETSGVEGPWPLLWLDRGLVRVACERIGESPAVRPLDAAVLVQALALAARHGGMGFAARRLAESWARLRDSGVTTPSRPVFAPYGKVVSDAEFIALAANHDYPAGRPVPGWKALAPLEGNSRTRSPVALTLVNP